MITIEKLKVKLVDMVKAAQETTPEFTTVIEKLASTISDERKGLKVYRVRYFRHVQQCGGIWVKATSEAEAEDIVQEMLDDDCADEDERVIRFDDALAVQRRFLEIP